MRHWNNYPFLGLNTYRYFFVHEIVMVCLLTLILKSYSIPFEKKLKDQFTNAANQVGLFLSVRIDLDGLAFGTLLRLLEEIEGQFKLSISFCH